MTIDVVVITLLFLLFFIVGMILISVVEKELRGMKLSNYNRVSDRDIFGYKKKRKND